MEKDCIPPTPHDLAVESARLLQRFENATFPKGCKDATWLDKADSVRQLSKDFWSHARLLLQGQMEKMSIFTKDDIQDFLARLSYDSAPEHLAALQAERDGSLASKNPQTAAICR